MLQRRLIFREKPKTFLAYNGCFENTYTARRVVDTDNGKLSVDRVCTPFDVERIGDGTILEVAECARMNPGKFYAVPTTNKFNWL